MYNLPPHRHGLELSKSIKTEVLRNLWKFILVSTSIYQYLH